MLAADATVAVFQRRPRKYSEGPGGFGASGVTAVTFFEEAQALLSMIFCVYRAYYRLHPSRGRGHWSGGLSRAHVPGAPFSLHILSQKDVLS